MSRLRNSVQIGEIRFRIKGDLFKHVQPEFDRKLPGKMYKIARQAKSFWRSEAGRRLKTSREAYQRSLHMEKTEYGYSVQVGVNGSKSENWLAKSVEEGNEGYDMKPGFMANAPKSPTGAALVVVNEKRRINKKGSVIRSVGASSKSGSWMYPKTEGIHLKEEVVKHIEEELAPKYIDELLKEII